MTHIIQHEDGMSTLEMSLEARGRREELTEESLRVYVEMAWDQVIVPVCKVNDDEVKRYDFVSSLLDPKFPASQWRISGALGFGGKVFMRPDARMNVSVHPEDSTEERERMKNTANEMLAKLYNEVVVANAHLI